MLATRHVLGPAPLRARPLARRLRGIDRAFADLFRSLPGSDQSPEPPHLVPGAMEWLRENDFVVGETLEALDGSLPAGFLSRLPGLREPEELSNRARVEVLAMELVQREEGQVELDGIRSFLEGYQEVRPLRLAELWALPALLRIALLEALLATVSGESELSEVAPFILSLRTLAGEDWREVVEALSRVEETLTKDPAGIHPRMDFRTRNRYRREVEEVAHRVGLEEGIVARRVLELARSHASEAREGHVGYYLVDEGKEELFSELGVPTPRGGTPRRRARRAGLAYFGVISLLTVALLVLFWLAIPSPWPFLPLILLGLVPAVGTAVALANWLSGQLNSPRALPRLDLREGIPPAFRTVVAVPTLLSSEEDIRGVLHTLETNYLANSDPQLRFVLLSDFVDADTERADEDEPLLATAAAGVLRLNERYGTAGSGPFLLLHRSRRWNPTEGRWMGWERKRGKLTEFNHLLLGQPSSLWVVEGRPGLLGDISFVVTLDADTLLPRDAAARLVGTLAHPLNRPDVGRGGRIRRGYSILQPRIEILPDADGGTLFSRLFGGVQGLDLYAHAAFDVYQDLFGVGIFAGKGIYDVRAFEASLAGRVPENSLLSHDLFEGIHGRAGLVSDLILLEDFPGHPYAYTRRAHRWIRGDWQLLPWLFSRVPAENGSRMRNPLSLLSRWMILDNLRRSLQAPVIFALLLFGWAAMPQAAGWWTLGLAVIVGIPFMTGSLDALLRATRDRPRRADLKSETRGFSRTLGRWGLELAFLPSLAWTAFDAIVRAVTRIYGSRKALLEWTSAAVTARTVRQEDSPSAALRQMRAGPLAASGMAAALLLLHGTIPGPAAPLLALWFLSPLIAYSVGRPPRARPELAGDFPPEEVRLLARRTWGYYERFQGPDGHWLAPDHFQEEPGGKVAYRTSPTNLAMAMASTVTAWDLGFVGTARLVTLIGNTVEGMEQLPRYRGHFLNWYNTRTLAPLHPQYVSTVDSGNLALGLLATREALREARHRPLFDRARTRGIQDTVRVICEILAQEEENGRTEAFLLEVEELESWIRGHLIPAREEGLRAYAGAVEELYEERLPDLEASLFRIDATVEAEETAESWASIRAWFGHLRSDTEEALNELSLFLPWLDRAYRETDEGRKIHDALVATNGEGLSLQEVHDVLEGHEKRLVAGAVSSGGGSGLGPTLHRSRHTTRVLLDDLLRLDQTLDRWFLEMDFSFLYDGRRELFQIGFSVSTGEPDPNHYDLLASEARIASAVALSKGDAPPAHWLHLARPYTWSDEGPVLLSWAGTMFEYLMPTLFLRMPPESVLDEACRRAVDVQRRYGRDRAIPWGMSESGYHVLSPEGDYQYRAFGVPLLGLRRDAGERLVVAPYASLMATVLAPGAVRKNLEHLVAVGGMGPWGPYEALDYGAEGRRVEEPRIVRSYMSHHQGMILVALGNHLTGNRLVERLHRDPRIATVEPYLHERLPWRRAVERKWIDRTRPAGDGRSGPGIRSWSPPVDRLPPPVHHLSSGELKVSMGADGRGGSRWGEWSIVRGTVGAGHPAGGPDLILMDRGSGRCWRALPDPRHPKGNQEVIFEPHRAEFVRQFNGIRTRSDVLLPLKAGVELRELSISNESGQPRHLRLALAVELALAPFDADLRHPAFQKLFVQAEALPGGEGLLFERRTRSPDETPPVVLITLLGGSGEVPPLRWGTSREAFLGRLGLRDQPAALHDPSLLTSPRDRHHPLDPMAAAVLDLDLEPWEQRSFTLILSVGTNRSSVIERASEFRSPRRREWARIQARAQVEGELLRLQAKDTDPIVWEELLAHLLHPRAANRLPAGPDSHVDLRQSTLWRWGISGDIPFILVEEVAEKGFQLLGELVRAQRWWRERGQRIDLVVVDRAPGEYQAPVRDRVRHLLAETGAESSLGEPGGVHLVRGDDVGEEERFRLGALAGFRLAANRGTLGSQLAAARPSSTPLPSRTSTSGFRGSTGAPDEARIRAGGENREAVEAPSALGGFLPDSGQYLIRLGPGETTPAPWANVIVGDELGFLVTESGGSFTWLEDAGEFRLTPWHNDPVLGLRGEVLYLRDEEDGTVWTPTPGPLGISRPHRIRHGWGRTTIEASGRGIEERLTWSLHPELPVKVVRVKLTNRGARSRRLSVIFFVDWVLGSHPATTAARLQVRFDSQRGTILARNPFALKFHERVAFLASDGEPSGMAVDRHEFLGATGPLDRIPVGLGRVQLGERISPAGEGCGALQREVKVGPGEEVEISFFLGAVESHQALDPLLDRLRGSTSELDPAGTAAAKWDRYLGRVRIQTPEPALDHLMNGWLPYQTVASRLLGRTGYYQSGGAFGFRDQLQDVYTMLPLDPTLAEKQLEAAARRQFREGDVLHWWHPGTTRGVKTRCSDDLLWLPFVLAHTVGWTGDTSLLDRRAPYLEAPPLPDGVDERYDAYPVSEEEESLWEHALRAVTRTATSLSPRGLPLIGTGDWNDGMDRVGREGKGESVWLGWFLVETCRLLIPLARARGEDQTATRLEGWSRRVVEAIESHAWDGEWYRRAFFDDGTPLGSRDSAEARIDSLAQSWATISGAADPGRARIALESAWKELVRLDEGIVLLLTPPFTGAGPDPGYIASYPPGVRENGGQYTHAAAWLLRAVARSGEGERVGQLLELLLPVHHAVELEDTLRYRVEPYVVAADVYGAEPHVGRGGWTWYTGSAGWIWRVILEDVLGMRREGAFLRLKPCIPPHWDGFELAIQLGNVRVEIRVVNPDGVTEGLRSCSVEGREVDPARIPLPENDLGPEDRSGDGEQVIRIEAVLGA